MDLQEFLEVFKLDKKTFDIETTAYGGAAQIGLEEFLDGTSDPFNEMIDIILEGLDEASLQRDSNSS